jgi:glycerol 3-phosphatase-2
VIWRGDTPIEGSADAVAALRASGVRVAFLTNNSSATVGQYVDKLARCGIAVDPGDVATSAMAAARLVAADRRGDRRVLACAGPGVVEALEENGCTVVHEPPAAAVVVGWHQSFDFAGLTAAARAIRAGARFVATNLDPTYPTGDGLLPGNGALVAAVATAAGAQPEVAGKPEPPMAALVRERFGDVGIVVGDRPSTDGAMAAALGWPFALVLSGIAGTPGEEPVPEPPPELLGDDLAAPVPALLGALPRG